VFFNINRARHVFGMTLHFVNHGWCVSTDAGWTTFESFNDGVRTLHIAKGYCDTMSLRDAALHSDPRSLSGNFAVIRITGTRITVLHDRNRGFPLWHLGKENTISNMPCTDREAVKIHSDTTVSATPDTVEISHFDPYYLEEAVPQNDYEATIEYLLALLKSKAEGLWQFSTAPVKSFISGGLDSMLAYALTKDFSEPISYTHFERDRFWFKCGNSIQESHWGYQQIHHWLEPTVLTSGATGDEMFLRGPAAVGMWSAWHATELRPTGYLNTSSYHWHYFSRRKNRKVLDLHWGNKDNLLKEYPTSESLDAQLLNMTVNDYQHWHLGNTLTWTPFKDIRILRAILALPVEDIIGQSVDGTVEKDLIGRLAPELLPALNEYKNHNEGHNLDKLFR